MAKKRLRNDLKYLEELRKKVDREILEYWDPLLPKIKGQSVTLVNASGITWCRVRIQDYIISRNGMVRIELFMASGAAGVVIDHTDFWKVQEIHKD